MGHNVIVFREEEIYITEDSRPEENSVGECNEHNIEDKTSDNIDNADGGIA